MGKKRAHKPVTKKGKIKRKPKKTSSKYKNYKVESGKLSRKNSTCPKCGPGVFMAEHKERKTCGKCGYMEVKKQTF